METATNPELALDAQPSRSGWVSGITVQQFTLVGVIVALLVVGAILKTHTFPTVDNLRAILTQSSVVGVIAIGMTMVIATSGIDLSVGSVVAAAGVAGALLIDNGAIVFVLATLGFALFLGLINAVSIAYGRVVPFVATLAMMASARGLALKMSDKTPISVLDSEGVRWFGTGKILGQPVSILIWFAVAIVGWLALNRTAYGRHVVSVGGNREAARIAGVPVRRTILTVYCVSALLAGIASVLLTGRLGSAAPKSGEFLELDAIGAVVVGGTSLAGGRATIGGTVMGVVVFGLMFNLLTQLDLATEWQQIVKGVIILVAVLVQRPERI